MLSDEQIQQVTARYQEQLKLIARRTGDTIQSLWSDLGSWDREDIDRFGELLADVIDAAKKVTVELSNGYYSTVVGKRPPAITARDVPSVAPDPEAPFLRLWQQLSQGAQFEDALRSGALEAANDAVGFVNATARRTAPVVVEQTGTRTVGWRRVLTGVSCEWCAQVSTQRYKSADSADFGHRSCDCTVVPIVGDRDPGKFINNQLAKRLAESQVSQRIAEGAAPRKTLQAAENAARRRDATLAELQREKNPERRRRLEERARKWDRQANAYKARAAEQRARVRSMRPVGTTGYVTPDGAPAAAP